MMILHDRRRAGLGAVVLLAATACGGGDPGSSPLEGFCAAVAPRVDAYLERALSESPVPDDERYGGTVVVATISEIAGGMNAFVSADYAATQHHQFVNLMTLLNYDEDLSPHPYLAESWDVSEDGTEITFHLRRDVYWHDGEPTDAHDVAFTYVRLTDPRTAYPNAGFWGQYVQGEDGVEVVDDFTIKVRLQPHAEFLDPWRAVGIMPEHLLGDVPPEELAGHPFGTECPVGNGPFVFRDHQPNERWVFAANPAFPEALGGRPYVDRYVYRVIPEQTTLLTELLTEGIDLYVGLQPDQVQQVVDAPNLYFVHFPSRNYIYVGWNARRPQLSDRRVRRALTLAVNRAEIVEALVQGYGTVANSSVPPFHWAYDESLGDAVPFDREAARALLDDAGWTDRDGDGVRENADGLRLAISIKYNQGNQIRQDIAEIMQAQLGEVGVEVRPQAIEWGTLVGQITDPVERDFDGFVMAWAAEFRVDDAGLFHSDRIDEPYAWAGTQNPEIDRLLDEIAITVDRDEARPLIEEYQGLLADEQPYTFFYYADLTEGVNVRLRDVHMDVRGEWVSVGRWWIDPASR
jgi:peptide/nickel transport system substrate-binding protein